MSGTDLDKAVDAAGFILGCDERYGVLDRKVRAELESLLDEGAKEQTERRAIAASREPVGPSRD
jgi:hypothetical protein